MRSSVFIAAASSAAVASAQSLTDVLSSNSDTLSLFTQFAQSAGLVDVINGLDTSTVFVPTNEALRAALDAFPSLLNTADDDDSDNDDFSDAELTQRFVNILSYHVVPGASLTVEDISPFPGSWYESSLDGYVVNPYKTDDDGVEVFSREKRVSTVAAADIEFDNGIIHTIDSVLLPPDNVNNTLLDMGLTYLYGALQQTDLTADVASANDITVFIPTYQAFMDVGSALQDIDEMDLSTILQYHVVTDGRYYTLNLSDGSSLPTLAQTSYSNDIEITVDESDGALYANNARVIVSNILLSNGVAHLIDQVMNPANDEDGAYTYNLDDADGEGVPAFEDASSAEVPSLTSGIPSSAVGTFTPSATFSAVSGAEGFCTKYKAEMLGGIVAAGLMGILLA